MAHEIEVIDGKAQMVYAGELPWHGLGTLVGDDLTPQEMAVEAGIDWKVEKHDVFFINASGKLVRCPKKQALVRSSDGRYMDVVSDDWNPIQNEEALSFFDEYVKAGGMSMHTAGSLKDGKVIWALAKVNDSFSLFGGKDKVDSFLLLSNPHQFGRGLDVRFTPIRVVCNNTLTMSLEANAKLGISMSHRATFNPEHAKLALAEAHTKMNTYKDMAGFLASKKFSQTSVFAYFNMVFPNQHTARPLTLQEQVDRLKKAPMAVNTNGDGNVYATSKNAQQAMEFLDDQPGMKFGKGSWWHAYNTVTYMTNHVLGRNNDTRLQSTWFGANRNKNIDALGAAIEFAEAA